MKPWHYEGKMLWGKLVIATTLVFDNTAVGQKAPSCPVGHIDVTGGNAYWWECASNCPGGAWADYACCCACIVPEELEEYKQQCLSPAERITFVAAAKVIRTSSLAPAPTTTTAETMQQVKQQVPSTTAVNLWYLVTSTRHTMKASVEQPGTISHEAEITGSNGSDNSDKLIVLVVMSLTGCAICLIASYVCSLALRPSGDSSSQGTVAAKAQDCEQGEMLTHRVVNKLSQVQPLPDSLVSAKLTLPEESCPNPKNIAQCFAPQLGERQHVFFPSSNLRIAGTPGASTTVSASSSRRSSKSSSVRVSEFRNQPSQSATLQVPVAAPSSTIGSRSSSRSSSPCRSARAPASSIRQAGSSSLQVPMAASTAASTQRTRSASPASSNRRAGSVSLQVPMVQRMRSASPRLARPSNY